MAKEKYKRFRKAVVDWLRTSADLVTLTGHDAGSSDYRIISISREDALKNEMVGVTIVRVLPLSDYVDGGHYDTLLELVCRHTDIGNLYDIVGAIEALAAQNATTLEDASFEDSGETLLATHVRFVGVGDIEVPTEQLTGVFELRPTIRVIWHEV